MCLLGLQISCYYWALCATCWTWGTDRCLVHCSVLWWAGSSQVCGLWAGVCAVGGRGLAAPSCISVTRFRAAGRGTVLWSVCCAAPSCCVRHGDEVDNQSLCYPLTEQADEASPPVESYVFGVSLQCHSSGLSNHIHTFHTVNSFYWAVSKGLADINESYQHSRGVWSQPCRLRKWDRGKVSRAPR